jgi:hypothetical protein
MVNDAAPAVATLGESEMIVGLGLLTVNVSDVEVPPQGPGLVTAARTVPALATSEVLIVPLTLPLLTNPVVRAEPFQFTVAPLTKFIPLTISGKPAAPAVLLVGERDVRLGTGLLITNASVPDVPPPGPGFETLTLTVPAVAMSLALIVAWS